MTKPDITKTLRRALDPGPDTVMERARELSARDEACPYWSDGRHMYERMETYQEMISRDGAVTQQVHVGSHKACACGSRVSPRETKP